MCVRESEKQWKSEKEWQRGREWREWRHNRMQINQQEQNLFWKMFKSKTKSLPLLKCLLGFKNFPETNFTSDLSNCLDALQQSDSLIGAVNKSMLWDTFVMRQRDLREFSNLLSLTKYWMKARKATMVQYVDSFPGMHLFTMSAKASNYCA